MTKITIEIDSGAASQGGTVNVQAASPGETARVSTQEAAVQPPAAIAAQAALVGAINAGPAPAVAAAGPSSPPIAESLGGGLPDAHQGAVSAGAACPDSSQS